MTLCRRVLLRTFSVSNRVTSAGSARTASSELESGDLIMDAASLADYIPVRLEAIPNAAKSLTTP
jgi:hypothetical protein